MRHTDQSDELGYQEARSLEDRWLRGDGRSRAATTMSPTSGAVPPADPLTGGPIDWSAWPGRAADTRPTVSARPAKPVPEDAFYDHGTNFETRWERLAGTGLTTPNELFFIRTHTRPPRIDAATWRLTIDGDGVDAPLSLGYEDLWALDHVRVTRAIECAGNGRSFFDTVGGSPTPGTPWKLGAIGVAEWSGVPLGALLERAGLRRDAVDVMPWGGDEMRVRRPMPVAKALLDDTIVALEMNGQALPVDHGFPARVIVPDWSGIASIKWLVRIEVSRSPLWSDWNTSSYVLIGPGHPPRPPALGTALTRQPVKSALELPWDDAVLRAGPLTLTGRAWSGAGPIARVEVRLDDGPLVPARLVDGPAAGSWTRWELPWVATPGVHTIRARATDRQGNAQPDHVPLNEHGYLYDGVVPHRVTVR